MSIKNRKRSYSPCCSKCIVLRDKIYLRLRLKWEILSLKKLIFIYRIYRWKSRLNNKYKKKLKMIREFMKWKELFKRCNRNSKKKIQFCKRLNKNYIRKIRKSRKLKENLLMKAQVCVLPTTKLIKT